MKHVSMTLLFAVVLAALTRMAAADPPSDFEGYKDWLSNASIEEKTEHFHGMSENYIKENGEKANEMRLCVNIDHNSWQGIEMWVSQKWASVGIRRLTVNKYVDYIMNRKASDKPWLVMFASTPYHMGYVVQPTDNQMRNLSCLAKVFKDDFNFGFMDFREAEKVFEAYDVRLDYGRSTPTLFVFDKGLAYPAKTSTLSAVKLANFAQNYTTECQYCGQQVVHPRSEIGMYLEYAKNEVANSYYYIESYNYLLREFNNTYVMEEVLKPNFGPKVGNKLVGYRLIFWIAVPLVLNCLFFFCMLCPLICCCCFFLGCCTCSFRSSKKSVEQEEDGDSSAKPAGGKKP